MKYLILILSLISVPAYSTEIIYSIYSNHIGSDEDYNEDLNLFGVVQDEWLLLTYNNSYDKRSYFAAKEVKEWNINKYTNVTAYAGVVKGYGGTDLWNINDYTPFVLPIANISYPTPKDVSIGLKFTYIPSSGGGVVITLLSVRF